MTTLKPFTRIVEDEHRTSQMSRQSLQNYWSTNNSRVQSVGSSANQKLNLSGQAAYLSEETDDEISPYRNTRVFRFSVSNLGSIYFTVFILFACLINHGSALVLNNQEPTPTRGQLYPRDDSTGVVGINQPSGTTDGLVVASDVVQSSALPQPFDTSLGNNFTVASCPQFFKTFLEDKDFKACYPLSLLLQTSVNFFSATKSLNSTTRVLDASCQVNFQKCSGIMSKYNSQLKSAANCGTDYQAQNPLVIQAVVGLSTYDVLYNAGCLKDQKSGAYCFARAVTNVTPVADSFPYYLPLGLTLSGQPSCSSCTQRTMEVFGNATGSSGILLANTYEPAAKLVDSKCGNNWVSLDGKAKSLASSDRVGTMALTIAAALVVGMLLP